MSHRVWRVWSAVLAALPYALAHWLRPVLPAQAPYWSLAFALLVVTAATVLAGGRRSVLAPLARALVVVGLAATVLIAVAELAAVAGLLTWAPPRVAASCESALAGMALLGWAAHPCSTPHEDLSGRVGLVSLAVGLLWPFSLRIVAELLGVYDVLGTAEVLAACSGPASYALCLVSGLAALMLLGRVLPVLDARRLLCGQILFWAFRALARDSVSMSPDVMEVPIAPAAHMVYLACAVLLLVLFRRQEMGPGHSVQESSAPLTEERDWGAVADALIASARTASPPPSAGEREVLVGMLAGKSGARIASERGVSASTVGTERSRLYAKLGIKKKGELMTLAEAVAPAVGPVDGSVEGSVVAGRLGWPQALGAVLLAALVVFAVPYEVKVGESYYQQVYDYAGWALAVLCLVVGTLGAPRRRQVWTVPHNLRQRVVLVLCPVVVAGLVWDRWAWGVHTYMIPCAVCLVLTVLALGEEAQSFGATSTARSVLLHLVGRAANGFHDLLSPDSLIIMSLSLLLSMSGSDYLIYSRLLSMLSWTPVVVLIVVCCIELWAQGRQAGGPAQTGLDPLAWLRSQGLGELQARVILDTAWGYEMGQIADRHHVTRATVKSYRQRGYLVLRVHSVAELRDALASSCDFRKNDKVHPR